MFCIDNINLNESLLLFKVQLYDGRGSGKVKRYVVAESLQDALCIAESYWRDESISLIGIWEVDVAIGRHYGK